MKKTMLALLLFVTIFAQTAQAGGMGRLHLAISEAVASEFVTSDSHRAYYALMDNMEITGQSEANGCDTVYSGKTTSLAGEVIFFDACINLGEGFAFDIAVSEAQAND